MSGVLSKYGLDEKIARYKFITHWAEIVGDDIAERTKPECLRGGALVIRVNSSIWAQELSFQKETILRKLKKFLEGDEIVEDLRFYVGADF